MCVCMCICRPFLYFCLQLDTSHHWAVYLTRSLSPQLQRRDEVCAGQREQVKICQMGRQRKPAHKPSLGWFIGLISENGKVKLITFPPEIAAQQWQMTSCQGQTVSHLWNARRCAPSSDSLTRGAALPDAPLWIASARRTGASPGPPTPLPHSWVPMQGPNDLGTTCQADGVWSRGLPYHLTVLSNGSASEDNKASHVLLPKCKCEKMWYNAQIMWKEEHCIFILFKRRTTVHSANSNLHVSLPHMHIWEK